MFACSSVVRLCADILGRVAVLEDDEGKCVHMPTWAVRFVGA